MKLDANQLKENIAEKIVEQINHFFNQNKQTPIKQWLEQAVTEKDIEKVAILIRDKGIELLNKEETSEKIEIVIQQYAQSRGGFLGNMILSMFSSDELALKIQRLVIDYLRSEDGYKWLSRAVQEEWSNLLEQEVQLIEPVLEKQETQQLVREIIQQHIPVEDWLTKPVQELLIPPFTSQIKEKIMPLAVNQLFAKLADSIPGILKELEVEKMVEKQVTSFPTSRIEEIILSISRKEFKLITYLGALLGGLIGFIQALIFIVI